MKYRARDTFVLRRQWKRRRQRPVSRAVNTMSAIVLCVGIVTVISISEMGDASAAEVEWFVDVPADHFHAQAIAALASQGWIEGTECDTVMFCPDEPFERWMMAVWLVRIARADVDLENVTSRFADVPSDEWWSPHVQRLAKSGITTGCGDGSRFCPTDSVTRAQMATFLVRAFQWNVSGAPRFVDVFGNYHEEDINILVATGITAGCSDNPPKYCPSQATTKGEMATFLARALNLIDISVSDLD